MRGSGSVMTRSGSLKLYRWVLAAAALLVVGQPAFAATLKAAGFDVVDSRRDLPAAETRRTLRDFADRARDADIAVVYYAGHGIEVDGANYLIPVDAKLEHDTDVYDEALSLDRVLVALEPAKQLRLVIRDACRDNPFT